MVFHVRRFNLILKLRFTETNTGLNLKSEEKKLWPCQLTLKILSTGKSWKIARVEYKKDWNPQTILHTIRTFANDIDNWGGGYIITGIDEENGMTVFPPITGLDKSSVDRISRELPEKMQSDRPPDINICRLPNRHNLTGKKSW